MVTPDELLHFSQHVTIKLSVATLIWMLALKHQKRCYFSSSYSCNTLFHFNEQKNCGKVKHELRVTSYQFRYVSYEFKLTSYKFKSTSYEFKTTSYEFKSLSCEFKSTSYEFKSTSYEFKYTS